MSIPKTLRLTAGQLILDDKGNVEIPRAQSEAMAADFYRLMNGTASAFDKAIVALEPWQSEDGIWHVKDNQTGVILKSNLAGFDACFDWIRTIRPL